MQASSDVGVAETVARRGLSAAYARTERIVAAISSFFLAAAAVAATMLNAIYESFKPARFAVVLGLLLALHVLCYSRVLWTREFTLYAAFLGYMALSLLWAPDGTLALNTLVPGLNFLMLL